MRTQKQIEANYTELIHAGEGIEIEKGKISATGGSAGGTTVDFLMVNNDFLLAEGYNATPITIDEVMAKMSSGKLIKLTSIAIHANSSEATWDLTFSGADNLVGTPSEVYFTGTRTEYTYATDTATVVGYRAVAEVTDDGYLYCELG